MFPSHDEQGNEMVVIRKEELDDFPKFIRHLRCGGYGATTGIVKVRLHEDDRNDKECMAKIFSHLQSVFTEKIVVQVEEETKNGKIIKRKKRRFGFNIAEQKTYKGAMRDPVYEYEQAISDPHRAKYVLEALNPASYNSTENCCTKSLQGGLASARQHFFDELERRSPYTKELLELGVMGKDVTPEDPILYAAGVMCYPPLQIIIANVLDMRKLGTILDSFEEGFDGITRPYLYCGTSHSFFCWHIEDAGLCSINYVFAGGSKIWFTHPPKYFGLVDSIAQGFRINKAHSACRAALVDHKSLHYDPQFMWEQYGVPYNMTKQDPGDFIITWPFTLHAGFNTATNMAIAVNFGDESWLEEAVYAPVCGCREDVVKFDFIPLLKIFRPDLLKTLMEVGSLICPSNHPRAIVQPPYVVSETEQRQEIPDDAASSASEKRRVTLVYECPEEACNKKFSEHRQRLKEHILRSHPNTSSTLLETLSQKYPPILKYKSTEANVCPVCQTVCCGTTSKLERHMKLKLKSPKLDPQLITRYAEELKKLERLVKRRNLRKTEESCTY